MLYNVLSIIQLSVRLCDIRVITGKKEYMLQSDETLV
jgi:hypothetical protein